MHDLDHQPRQTYHMTPQFRKNQKYYQIQRLNQRISLLKHQLQKQKDDTQSDQVQLRQMTTISESFQNKLISELSKCHELKQVDLKTHKTHVQHNLNAQTQIQTFEPNFNLYNQDRLNSKANFNTQISTGEGFSVLDQEAIPKKQLKEKEPKNDPQRLIKKVVNSGTKNTTPKQKNKHNYLKETFLTSIMLVLFTLLLHKILSLF